MTSSNPSAPSSPDAATSAQDTAAIRPDQRLSARYRFDDPNMDLFFMSALSMGPAGGLDIGQAFYVASRIVDGDADSWVQAFGEYGELEQAQADTWAQRGWQRAAGEARLKAFASFRSAWQFAAPGGEAFVSLYRRHQRAFAQATDELDLPATFFSVPYEGASLPGLFLRNERADAPIVLVIGGADTSMEDLFLSYGRALWQRGYSLAIADLPGQGITPLEGLHWEIEPERPIGAVIDTLVAQFGATPERLALIGLSLGGYFATRAAQYEPRLATVVASTPFPEPGRLFEASVRSAMQSGGGTPSTAALRSWQTSLWKSGTPTPDAFLARWAEAKADPEQTTVPFLSVLGGGDSPVFTSQARDWHARLRSERKDLVFLDASTGADGHCQVNARIRLVQEASGWMDEIFGAEGRS